MEYAVRSFIGTRPDQQDCANVVTDKKGIFAVICDGMGGREYGKLAADTAVKTICEKYACSFDEHFQNFLIDSAEELDRMVSGLTSQKTGTTIIAVYVNKSAWAYWLSVGDSRLYILRDRTLKQATCDHNYYYTLNKLLSEGKISREAFEKKKERGEALISFLGMDGLGVIDLSVQPFAMKKGDVFLLCSDGLYKALDLEKIKNVLVAEKDVGIAADKLIENVKQSKKTYIDNTTFIIMRNGD